MKSKIARILCMGIIVSLSLVGTVAFAQAGADTGLRGKITDPSGAVVPGTTVTVLRAVTGERRTVLSNDAGDWEARFLTPGTYQLTF